jgi:hypothetical protein
MLFYRINDGYYPNKKSSGNTPDVSSDYLRQKRMRELEAEEIVRKFPSFIRERNLDF